MANQNEHRKQWAKIVAKAWADEEYKAKLMADPAEVLKSEGVKVPEDVEIKCVEAAESQAWLVLPPKPDGSTNTLEERLPATSYCGIFCGIPPSI